MPRVSTVTCQPTILCRVDNLHDEYVRVRGDTVKSKTCVMIVYALRMCFTTGSVFEPSAAKPRVQWVDRFPLAASGVCCVLC